MAEYTKKSSEYQGSILPQRQIQAQDIYSRLTEKPQLPSFNVFFDELTNEIFIKMARVCNAGNLIVSRRGADMRIESAARGCHQINRNGLGIARISLLQGLHTRCDCL